MFTTLKRFVTEQQRDLILIYLFKILQHIALQSDPNGKKKPNLSSKSSSEVVQTFVHFNIFTLSFANVETRALPVKENKQQCHA